MGRSWWVAAGSGRSSWVSRVAALANDRHDGAGPWSRSGGSGESRISQEDLPGLGTLPTSRQQVVVASTGRSLSHLLIRALRLWADARAGWWLTSTQAPRGSRVATLPLPGGNLTWYGSRQRDCVSRLLW